MSLVCSYLSSIWGGERPLLLSETVEVQKRAKFHRLWLSPFDTTYLCKQKYLSTLPKIGDRHITQSRLGMAWIPLPWDRGTIHLKVPYFKFLEALHFMASRCLVRSLWTSKYVPSSLPRLIRSYSQPVIKTYDHILVDLPKPGVGLSMSMSMSMPFHSIQPFKLPADVSVVYQSPSIVQEHSMPCPPRCFSNWTMHYRLWTTTTTPMPLSLLAVRKLLLVQHFQHSYSAGDVSVDSI